MAQNADQSAVPPASRVEVVVDAPLPPPTLARRAAGFAGEALALAAILVLAWGLRTLSFQPECWFNDQLTFGQKVRLAMHQGILWDDGTAYRMDQPFPASGDLPAHSKGYHPDERFIAGLLAPRLHWPTTAPAGQAGQPEANDLASRLTRPTDWKLFFDARQSPLNPYVAGEAPDFAYGQFPLLLLVWLNDHVVAQGRSVSQLIADGLHPRQLAGYADLVTLLATWWMARLWRGRRVGLLAALLLAVSPMHLEHARYFVVDPFMAACTTLAMAFLATSLRRLRGWAVLLAAICTGLAVACKLTALFLVVPWAIWLVRWAVFAQPRTSGHWVPARVATWTVLSAVLAFAAFRVASPYSFGAGLDLARLAQAPATQPAAKVAGRADPNARLAIQSALPARLGKLKPGEPENPDFYTQAQLDAYYAAQPALARWLFEAGLWPNDLWMQAMNKRAREQREYTGLPYFRHCFGRTPVLYSLDNLCRYAIGWGVMGFAALGAVLALVSLRRPPRDWDWHALLFTAVTLLVLLVVGRGFAQITRYYLGISPLIIVLAAGAMGWLMARCRAWQVAARPALGPPSVPAQRRALLGSALVWLPRGAIAYSLIHGLGFMAIFAAPTTRVQADDWIFTRYPAGTALLRELPWEDALPDHLPGRPPPEQYKLLQTSMYDFDDAQKRDALIANLQDAEAIILASDRFHGAVTQMPDKYPMSGNFYRQLLTGQLGFRVERVFRQAPSLLGFTFPEDNSEHTWQIYTRPTVVVLRRDADTRLTYEQLEERLPLSVPNPPTDREIEALIPPDPGSALKPDLVLYPGQVLRSAWSVLNSPPIGQALLWWAILLALGAITWPALWPLMQRWPDGGWGLARIVGVTLPALLAWWVGTLTGLGWNLGVVLACVLAYAAGAIWIGGRHTAAWLDWNRTRAGGWWLAETLMLGVFVVFLFVRVGNGAAPMNFGEKAGELVCLQQFVQGCTLPLDYPWFAGEPSRYYNFGWILWSLPTMLGGFEAGVGFNLAMASVPVLAAGAFFCLAARLTRSTAWGLVGALVAVLGGNWWWLWQLYKHGQMGLLQNHHAWWLACPLLPLALAVLGWRIGVRSGLRLRWRFAWTVGGALVGAGVAALIVSRLHLWPPPKPAAVGQDLSDSVYLLAAICMIPAVLAALLAALAAWRKARPAWIASLAFVGLTLGTCLAVPLAHASAVGTELNRFLTETDREGRFDAPRWWSRLWDSTRVTPGEVTSPIQEYPQFTFTFGDLHGHAIGMPLLLAVLALGLVIAERRGRAWGATVLAGVLLGALFAANIWDLMIAPVALGAVLVGSWLAITGRDARRRLHGLRPTLGALGGASLVLRIVAMPVQIALGSLRRLITVVALPLGVIVALALLAAGPFTLDLQMHRSDEGGIRPVPGPWASGIDFLQLFGPHLLAAVLALVALILLVRGRWRWVKVLTAGVLIAAVWVGCLWFVPAKLAPRIVDQYKATLVSPPLESAKDGELERATAADAANNRRWGATLVMAMTPTPLLQPVAKYPRPVTIAQLAVGLLLTALIAVPFMPNRRAMMALGLLVAGLALAVVIEWVEVLERMNTIFKFGLGVWWLLVLGAVGLLSALTGPLAAAPARPGRCFGVTWIVGVALAGWSLAFLTLPSHLLAIARKHDRPKPDLYTLDATRFLPIYESGDAAVVTWLRSRNDPRLVVAETGNGYYTWPGRIATYAGVRSLLGWGYHSSRHGVPGDKVNERAERLDKLYRSADPQLRATMLELLKPDYVIVSELEYATFGADVADRIAATPGLHEVFRSGESRVFAFDPVDLYNDRLRDALMPAN